jgi:GNAT superfamily N-acetyltransferase
MEIAAVLAEFDEQMRRHPPAEPGARIEADAHVTRVLAEGTDWSGVVWSDLSDSDADETIAAEIERFSVLGQPWEWKYYSYDRPADLPDRLRYAGFMPDAVETVLVAEVAELALGTVQPAGVELVPVVDQAGVDALVQVHDEVFGGSHGAIGAAVLAGLGSAPPSVAAVVAMAGGRPISSGRVEFPNGTDFATIWGGGTLSAWRGRGVFRSLVAYRAALAVQRGYRYLQVDASAESRPILLRLGFVELAKTTPFRYGSPKHAPAK